MKSITLLKHFMDVITYRSKGTMNHQRPLDPKNRPRYHAVYGKTDRLATGEVNRATLTKFVCCANPSVTVALSLPWSFYSFIRCCTKSARVEQLLIRQALSHMCGIVNVINTVGHGLHNNWTEIGYLVMAFC